MHPQTNNRIADLPLPERVRVQQVRLLSDNWYTLKTTRFDFLRSDGQWQAQDRETYDRGNGATAAALPARAPARDADAAVPLPRLRERLAAA